MMSVQVFGLLLFLGCNDMDILPAAITFFPAVVVAPFTAASSCGYHCISMSVAVSGHPTYHCAPW
ncbi:hypothetical protein E2C01_005833 [Portunus trituberculatus]|uniref:Uncharacterized protein n=1 Tax=Portunus trituberculatus TaxID=210409 RepID=A0A5B7D069_PORTR|nr:hypothetical protein [Portunus trituberculatus]